MADEAERPTESRPSVSVVVPVYNSEATLRELCRRLTAVLEQHAPPGGDDVGPPELRADAPIQVVLQAARALPGAGAAQSQCKLALPPPSAGGRRRQRPVGPTIGRL